MWDEKAALLACYGLAALGMGVALPLAIDKRLRGRAAPGDRNSAGHAPASKLDAMAWCIGAVVLIVAAMHAPLRFVALSLLGASLWAIPQGLRSPVFPLTFVALQLGALLLWWRHPDANALQLSGKEAFFFVVLTCLARLLLVWPGPPLSGAGPRKFMTWVFGAFAIVAVALSFSTGLVRQWAAGIAWHHWSAYIGPAQMLLEGVQAFRDIPLQYGLGPTLLLMQGCRSDCWLSMYWLTATSSSLLVISIGYLFWRVGSPRNAWQLSGTLLIALISCMVWTAFPPDLTSVLATPSTFGLRFLPGTLMLVGLVMHTSRQENMPSPPRWGHLAWAGCILWAPEAATHATALWVPYFIWGTCASRDDGLRLGTIALAMLKLTAVLATLAVAFSSGFHLIHGEWPNPRFLIVYLLHPPGPLPVNPFGPVWFAVACLICLTLGLARSAARSSSLRSAWLVGLLAVASFTYYLGRSHDNNVLNLMPYLALSLFASKGLDRNKGALFTFSSTLLATLVGGIPAMGASNLQEAASQHQLIEFAPRQLIGLFHRSGSLPEPPSSFRPIQGNLAEYQQAREALQFIQSNYGESVEILEAYPVVDAGSTLPAWSGLHSHANFTFIPSPLRREILWRTSQRLQRPGWILHHKQFDAERDLADYDAVYVRDITLELGDFRAIRYAPDLTKKHSPSPE